MGEVLDCGDLDTGTAHSRETIILRSTTKLDRFDVQTSSTSLFASHVINQSRNLVDFIDSVQYEYWVGSVTTGNRNFANSQHALDESLAKADVVDVNHFYAIRSSHEDSKLVDEPLRGEFVTHADSAVEEQYDHENPNHNDHGS